MELLVRPLLLLEENFTSFIVLVRRCQLSNDVWVLDRRTNSWEIGHVAGLARYSLLAVGLGNNVFVVGGFREEGKLFAKMLDTAKGN